MTQNPENTTPHSELSEEQAQALIRSLLHKEGTWIHWGQACQTLQKAGYSAQKIFEDTGFQGSQQNQIIVAAQVYDSIIKAGISNEMQSYFQGPRSDVLYEFRILNQDRRVAAAQLAMEKRLDVDGAHELARALKELSRRSRLPEGFSNHPGDAVAYLIWKQAREKKDIQERSRLIAKGLQFAYSPSAREQIEKLLTDFNVVAARKAPLLPIYRLEAEEELSRIVPLAGRMSSLSAADLEAIPTVESQGAFNVVQLPEKLAILPLPGWQVVLKAQEPVAILCESDKLPTAFNEQTQEVLVLVDRRSRLWDVHSYFLIEQDNQLEVAWLEEEPEFPILGQVVLILRPKKILDENNLTEPWQIDD